jgi:monovalent cation/hydrogen antiporter
MEEVTTVLVLLLTVVVSGVAVRLSPVALPLPILQIAMGAGLSYAIGFKVRLDPQIFFLLFVPPLLFLDGWRIPKRAFFRDGRTILTMAFGLVFFTVLGLGFFIHWTIPSIPPAVAFALAAILSPTDPVAVSAVTSRSPVPPRLMNILEGESLLNDASGLVCFRFAVAAALTGGFSLSEASLAFLKLAAGGITVGVAIAWGVGVMQARLAAKVGEEPGTHILVSILIPFAAYLAAERLGFSGILAAAAAGMAMNYVDLLGRGRAATRMRRGAVWDTIQLALNGIIFVLLGGQLPGILESASESSREAGTGEEAWLLLHVASITGALTLLRFAWVWASLRLTLLRASPRFASLGGRKAPTAGIGVELRLVALASLAGVRGAVTLAGILTLPVAMPDGSPFPARDLAVFLAMGVILLSLLVASLGLPVLARGLERGTRLLAAGRRKDAEEEGARIAAAGAAIRRLEQSRRDGPAAGMDAEVHEEAAMHVLTAYRGLIDREKGRGDAAERMRQAADARRSLRIEALRAERDELRRLRLSDEIDDETFRRLLRETDLKEASLSE